MDIRCRAIYHLVLSMRDVRDSVPMPVGDSERTPFIQGNYNLEREASEPDPHIVDLNSELTKCEGSLSTAVGEREHACVFLATLLDLVQPHISFPQGLLSKASANCSNIS